MSVRRVGEEEVKAFIREGFEDLEGVAEGDGVEEVRGNGHKWRLLTFGQGR